MTHTREGLAGMSQLVAIKVEGSMTHTPTAFGISPSERGRMPHKVKELA